jgi:rRNA maturation endonuclease Nob1
MPEGHDIEHDTSEISSEYECLGCGMIVEAERHPGECADCGGEFQNRAKSLE